MFHKIKELCKAKNITIAELERKSGLKPRSIDKWKNSTPSADKLLLVAKVLGTTVENLMED